MNYKNLVLDADSILNPLVPAAWKHIIDAISAMETMLKSSSETKTGDLNALQNIILANSAGLLEADQLTAIDNGEGEKAFLKALNLLMHLQKTIEGSSGIMDTSGSKTLRFHKSDARAANGSQQGNRSRIAGQLGVSPRDTAAIEIEVKDKLDLVARREKIIQELTRLFDLKTAPADLNLKIHSLFETFFPATGIIPTEVDIVLSANLVAFCIPFNGTDLTTDRFQKLSADNQLPIRAFLKKVKGFKQSYFSHFPAFGFFEATTLPEPLLTHLATVTQVTRSELIYDLNKMVMILPKGEVDRFLVHDLWGHSWQGSLFEFNECYEGIANFRDEISLTDSTVAWPGGTLAFGECFVGSADQLTFDKAKFETFLHAEMAERIPVVMGPVLAELLADYVEYKFIADNPSRSDDLGSSSEFKFMPSKIDFLLKDLPFYYSQATKVYRRLAAEEGRRQSLADQLVTRGATRAAAEVAVAQTVDAWEQWAEFTYSPHILYRENSQGLNINVFTHLTLNFLAIQKSIASLDADLLAYDSSSLDLEGWRDLIIFCVAAYFEGDRRKNLWRIDEFLTLRVKEFCLKAIRTN